MRYFILICCFLSVSQVLQAQQVVTGRITDASDGTPIPNAAVFIANTTIGTTTDGSGKYTLTIHGEGSYEIVVSHVAYQPVFHKINTPKPFHQIDLTLKSNEIEEVTITAINNYTQKDVDFFWRKFLLTALKVCVKHG